MEKNLSSGKIVRRGRFSLGKNIPHITKILSLFLDQVFPNKVLEIKNLTNRCESAKLSALRAHLLTCLACLGANVPTCLECLVAHVPTCLACLRAHLTTCLAWSRANASCVLSAHVLTCLACLHANVLMRLACSRANVSYMLTCQHVFLALRAYVLAYYNSNNKNNFSITCFP